MTSRIIHKYPLQVTDTQSVMLPRRADILCVKNQRGELMLWAQHDEFEESRSYEEHTIHIVGTGRPFEPVGGNAKYIDTVMMYEDTVVWHIFQGAV